jgi:hypothetical protein
MSFIENILEDQAYFACCKLWYKPETDDEKLLLTLNIADQTIFEKGNRMDCSRWSASIM